MGRWLNYFTFDVASDFSFGVSLDCLEQKKAHPWVEIAQDLKKGLTLVASLNFYWPLNILLRYLTLKMIIQRGKMHWEMSSEKVQSRLGRETDRPDFVTAALAKSSNDLKASISVN
jgi:cytochrome P450